MVKLENQSFTRPTGLVFNAIMAMDWLLTIQLAFPVLALAKLVTWLSIILASQVPMATTRTGLKAGVNPSQIV